MVEECCFCLLAAIETADAAAEELRADDFFNRAISRLPAVVGVMGFDNSLALVVERAEEDEDARGFAAVS